MIIVPAIRPQIASPDGCRTLGDTIAMLRPALCAPIIIQYLDANDRPDMVSGDGYDVIMISIVGIYLRNRDEVISINSELNLTLRDVPIDHIVYHN